MKKVTPALLNFLNAAIAAPDSPIAMADCFTFALASGNLSSGLSLHYTNADQPIVHNGVTFLANGPLVQGLNTVVRPASKSTNSRSRLPRGRPISSMARCSSTLCATAPSMAASSSATASS
jgi:hypothetical protein